MERNIRLLIEYDGGRYDGWQRLGKGHGVTIQGKLEDVLGKMTGEKIELIGAGRTDAKAKKYLYRIAVGDVPCVFDRKYTWYCFDKLDVTAMKKAAALLVGEHDFKAFCSNKRTNKSTVREIYDIDIYADTRELQITVYGNGFLYNMVRIIVGTLIEVGKGERRPEEMTAILESRDRTKAGATAAAQGLFLQEVEY